MRYKVYGSSGQTSVAVFFAQLIETIDNVTIKTLNLLEAILYQERSVRIYKTGSSEFFGDTGTKEANESLSLRSRSPYAVAKVCAHNLTSNYHKSYQMFACSSILFEQFATRIAASYGKTLKLVNLDSFRDWAWALDCVEALWQMLQTNTAREYVITPGRTVTLDFFLEQPFDNYGLDCRLHARIYPILSHPTDIKHFTFNPLLAESGLKWRATNNFDDVIRAEFQVSGRNGVSGTAL